MKLIVELWSNAAKNEKLFLRNHKMLVIDFHTMDKKISMGHWQRKSQCKSFGMQHARLCLNLWYVAFFNDITYQRISQNIEKYTNSDTKNIFTRKYTNRSK